MTAPWTGIRRAVHAAVRFVSVGWRWLFGAVFGAALLAFLLKEPPATFTVNAETELVQVELGQSPIHWYFNDAKLLAPRPSGLLRQGAPSPDPPTHIAGSVEFMPGATVIVERAGHGETTINARVDSRTQSAAIIYDEHEQPVRTMIGRATITLDTTASGSVSAASLPMSGTITVGNRVLAITTPTAKLLKHGNVRVFGKTLWFDTLFEAGTADLEQGDFLDLAASDRDTAPIGLVTIDERPNLHVLAKTIAPGLTVNTFQGEGFVMSASLFSRLQHDPVVQSFWVAAGSLWGILSSMSKRKKR
jgi:hypothetical protein